MTYTKITGENEMNMHFLRAKLKNAYVYKDTLLDSKRDACMMYTCFSTQHNSGCKHV